jgi:hypothetical protein
MLNSTIIHDAAHPLVNLTRLSLRSSLREGVAEKSLPAGSLVEITGQVTPSLGG